MKKLLSIILTGVIVISGLITSVSAKGITRIDSFGQIDNAGVCEQIEYEGQQAYVFYGENGIDIISESVKIHFDTNFSVLKLIAVGDVNGDGYSDFLTYQNTGKYLAQLITVNGKTGESISSYQATRIENDDLFSTWDVSTTVLKMVSLNNGTAAVIYDYTIACIDLASGEEVYKQQLNDNVWDLEVIGDVSADGTSDLAYSTQYGAVGIISGSTGEILNESIISNAYDFIPSWAEENTSYHVQMNIWDLYYEAGILYATSEDGRLYLVDVNTLETEEIDLATDAFTAIENTYKNTYSFIGTTIATVKTIGILDSGFFGYRIDDSTDQYLLIDCYMGHMDSEAADGQSTYYPKQIVVYDKVNKTVAGRVSTGRLMLNYSSATICEYEGNTAIAVAMEASDATVTLNIYDFDGELLYGVLLPISTVSTEQSAVFVDYENDEYHFQVIEGGYITVNKELDKLSYMYDKIAASYIGQENNNVIFQYATNGKVKAIISYASDVSDVVWQYNYNPSYTNKGLEFVTSEYDYNGDGIQDVICIGNSYNKKDEKVASYFIVLNGADGSEMLNRTIKNGVEYDEKGKAHTAYLKADSLTCLHDLDKDGKLEFLVNGMLVLSNGYKIKGSTDGWVDAKGTQLEIGDVNGDEITDYVVITDKTARLYTSKLKATSGNYGVTYSKTNITRTNNEKLKNSEYATKFGDIDNDGVTELIFMDYNKEGRQVYTVVNGATLKDMYTLIPSGLKDWGESATVLPFDVTGDGYNELFIYDGYEQAIVDGKSGDIMKYSSAYLSPADAEDYNPGYDSGWVPENIISFYENTFDQNFTMIEDQNGDGINDYAIFRSYWEWEGDFAGTSMNVLCYYSGADNKLMNEYVLPSGSNVQTMMNLGNALLLSGYQGFSVVDIKDGTVKASFSKSFESVYDIGENTLLAISADKSVYCLNLEKFVQDLQYSIDGNQLHIKWNSQLDGNCVVTVYDNGTAVYRGSENEATMKLYQGDHRIQIEVDDGQGKTSIETLDTTLEVQENKTLPVAGALAVVVVICLYAGLKRKLYIKKNMKGGKK